MTLNYQHSTDYRCSGQIEIQLTCLGSAASSSKIVLHVVLNAFELYSDFQWCVGDRLMGEISNCDLRIWGSEEPTNVFDNLTNR